MIRALLIAPIRFYRYFLSPWVGHGCRFTPTCSVYAIEAIETHGAIKGLWLAAKRIGRCNPWCQGGHDPVPPGKNKPGHSHKHLHKHEHGPECEAHHDHRQQPRAPHQRL
ncbi:membrane protein insertion efficiency factor YidD [Pusillimonas sp. ANT_WB101]|uniref:membrane protein insertion efficiency factor YidD n=1 Tax=Pusillimonas sp. ANT_WB101 TaxID=2597356 RepID=UPI0011EFA5D3|nr:membrane protein insertion efficiency factor YidD [Pusillimonas sp. ANT_WB101]KAA0890987.1 membrane protein insertion efficiency factor YidD [Pusillimonas sp. ANT_WB101]